MSLEQLQALEAYSACDIADALLKLGVKGAGFLPDLKPIPGSQKPQTQALPIPPPSTTLDPLSAPPADLVPTLPTASVPTSRKIIAPISTALFIAKGSDSFPDAAPPLAAFTQTFSTGFSNIPPGAAFADLTTPDTILIVSQPPGQSVAVVGGIMATRISRLGAKAIIVDGRVRDLSELRSLTSEMPIWSKSTSIIGTGGEAKAWGTNVEMTIGGTIVRPGDIGVVDEEEVGVVVIPKEDLEDVLRMLPKMVEADERVMEDVRGGGDVGTAFKTHRGK